VLVHTEIKELSNLADGSFGLQEPVERIPASLNILDAVIVPLVAFDRHGARLGYGMGFYDAFLHELPRSVERIGLAFSIQEMNHIPVFPHDEPLDTIVTEQEIIHVR
jgi:5-formyltetrahydrofolate cyclo-ligase